MPRKLFQAGLTETRSSLPVILRLQFSADWATPHPWSEDGVILPWIGARRKTTPEGRLLTLTFGPLALLAATTPLPPEASGPGCIASRS